MVKRATSGVLVLLLLFGLFTFNWPITKAQTASPSQAVITVSGVPASTNGLAVEVTVDTSIVKLGSSATSDVSGSLVVVDGMSAGVGIISTSTALPASFTITVPFDGVAAGTSMVTVGNVLDMLGGSAIAGASAMADVSSVTVASSSTSTSSTSSTGGAGGMLSSDTLTITINGQSVNQTSALNVTVAFSDPTVAQLDTGVTFMGTGAAQLLTDVNATTGVLTAVWSGNITDGVATITGMLKPGTMGGTSMISVTKVEAAGGTDITGSVVATVNPTSVTNSSPTAGSFALIGPDSAVGPGKVAVAISGLKTSGVKLNGAVVDFVSGTVGIAEVTLPSAAGSVDLKVTSGGMTTSIGTLTVTAGNGTKPPKVNSARAQNNSTSTILRILGQRFPKDTTSVEIVPTDHATSSPITVKGKVVKAVYSHAECLPNGSYVNVTTPGGTASKKIKVKGSCSNPL